jgi:hypothetical protein
MMVISIMMMILRTDPQIGNGHNAIWKDKKVETSNNFHVEIYFLKSPNHKNQKSSKVIWWNISSPFQIIVAL